MTDRAADLPAFKTIELAREGRLLRLTFNRPEAMNAVNAEILSCVAKAWGRAE